MQTDATLLTNRSKHCWMLHVASVCRPLHVNCCASFETGQTFQSTTPNISFVLWSVAQQCWIHLHSSLCMDYKDLWFVFFPQCTAGPNNVGSCCIRLHTTANTHATIVGSWSAHLHAVLQCNLTFNEGTYMYLKVGFGKLCLGHPLFILFSIECVSWC